MLGLKNEEYEFTCKLNLKWTNFCAISLLEFVSEWLVKMKKWSSQWTQFMQLHKEAWKKKIGLQQGLNPWPHNTSAMLLQLSYEATDVGSRSNFFFIQASLRNCINCVHCNDHFFIFISFPQFIYDYFISSIINTQNDLYWNNFA